MKKPLCADLILPGVGNPDQEIGTEDIMEE